MTAPSLKELRAISDDELERQHDAIATNTQTDVNYLLAEIRYRRAERQTKRIERYTLIVTIATIVNVVLVVVSVCQT